MALDETGLINGELYTILLNKEAKGRKGAIAAFIKGTKADKITQAISDSVPFETRIGIKELTLDLANNMDWIARQIAPNGLHTYDRFHVQQLVTEAVQTIRINYRWKAIAAENEAVLKAKKDKMTYTAPRYDNGDTQKQLLARSRYLLFKPPNKWCESQQQRAHILFKVFPEIEKAYKLSLCFRGCYEHVFTRKKAVRKFRQWFARVEISDISEMKVAAESIKRNMGGILNYFEHRATNAAAESFNAKLKGFRSLVRGVTDRKFFLFRIAKIYG